MSDDRGEAPPECPAASAGGCDGPRLVQYLLLQALIVAACIFGLRLLAAGASGRICS